MYSSYRRDRDRSFARARMRSSETVPAAGAFGEAALRTGRFS
jgi:hypothetical protein